MLRDWPVTAREAAHLFECLGDRFEEHKHPQLSSLWPSVKHLPLYGEKEEEETQAGPMRRAS